MKRLKISSVLLSAVMCMSLVAAPVNVMADDTAAPSETQSTEAAETSEPEATKEKAKDTEKPKTSVKETKESEKENPEDSKVKETTKPSDTDATESSKTEPAETGEPVPSESVVTSPAGSKETETSETNPSESVNKEKPAEEPVPSQTDRKDKKKAVIASGKCGSNLTSALDSEGTLTITGSGEMYDSLYCPWKDFRSSIKAVVFDGSITSIGTGAFYGSKIKTITIPGSITYIGFYAFEGSSELESVTFAPDSKLKTIDVQAFSDCTSLKSIEIPSTVTTLGNDAFARCSSLSSFALPDGIKIINDGTFGYCTSLKDISIPSGVTKIGDSAFSHCEALESVSLPESVTLIDYEAFSYCKSLMKVVIPVGVTRIGAGGFKGCAALTSVVIDKSLHNKSESGTFAFCPNVQFIYYSYDIEYSASDYGTVSGRADANSTDVVNLTIKPITNYLIDKVTYKSGDKTVEVTADDNGKYSFTMPVGKVTVEVTYKESDVPTGTCGENLTWVLDAQGTLTISGSGDMDTWSDETMRPWKPYLDSIKSVVVNDGVTSIGQCAFMVAGNLTSVSLPGTLKVIRSDVFKGCRNLTSINLPDGLEVIGVWAFAECDSLTGITIPNSVKEIHGGAFNGCDNLKDVVINEELFKSLSYNPFDNCPNVAMNFVSFANEIIYKKTGTSTVKVTGVSSKVAYVVIPSVIDLDGITYKVTAIDSNAFRGNMKITSVSIGSNVSSIGGNAFYGCKNLVKVSGGSKVKTIGANAFAYCSKLSSFKITSKVLSKIGSYAFNKDSKLKTVYFKYTTKLTKKGVKKSLKASKVKTVKVKKSKVKKYKKYFTKKNCGRKVKVKK